MTEAPPSVLREARLQHREHRIDPEGALDPIERRRIAEQQDREFFRELGRRSGESRRQRAQLLAAFQQRAVESAAGLVIVAGVSVLAPLHFRRWHAGLPTLHTCCDRWLGSYPSSMPHPGQ
jgi:hypothetical protein